MRHCFLVIIRPPSIKNHDDDENAPYVNTKNYERYGNLFFSVQSLRKAKAWHVLFIYLERRMRYWRD